MQAPLKPDELARYAELIVRGCVALGRGDTLLVQANTAHRELVAALAEAAYAAGAASVDPVYEDARVAAARIRAGRDGAIGHRPPWQLARSRAIGKRDTVLVHVMDEFESKVLAGLPPERLAEDSVRARALTPSVAKARRERRLRGTICAWPTAEWAARVYPGLDAARAQRRLARDLLSFCRISSADPPGHRGWTDHLAQLRRRAARLTKLELRELRVRDRGTDLKLRIVPSSLWRGGGEETFWGHRIAMNVPTEECFVSPDAAANAP